MGEQVDARLNGDVAQLGEHLPCKQGVESSNLFISIARVLNEDERQRRLNLVEGRNFVTLSKGAYSSAG